MTTELLAKAQNYLKQKWTKFDHKSIAPEDLQMGVIQITMSIGYNEKAIDELIQGYKKYKT